MRNEMIALGTLLFILSGCEKTQATQAVEAPEATVQAPAPLSPAPASLAATSKKLFLDVHELGPGKVTAEAVAGAHKKDLAAEGKHDVELKAYWLDEKEGKIYCLAEAPSAEAFNTVHREAHGLLANKITEVSADTKDWTPSPGAKLYLDVHHFGPGKVNAQAVAEAHQRDIQVGPKHSVKYLNYWFDAENGTVTCLSQAPNAEAALAVHKEAHGLMPDSIEEVSEGR